MSDVIYVMSLGAFIHHLSGVIAVELSAGDADIRAVQGISIRPFPGWENAEGKLRQKR